MKLISATIGDLILEFLLAHLMGIDDICNIDFPRFFIETIVEVLVSVLFVVIVPGALKFWIVEVKVENLWQLVTVEATQAIEKRKHIICEQVCVLYVVRL